MKKKRILLVQGDVFLISIARIPIKSIETNYDRQKGFVLAEGEASGHAHRVIDPDASIFRLEHKTDLPDNGGTIVFRTNNYIKNKKEMMIVHEEHKPLIVPSGIWKVGIVREYDPFSGSVVNIGD